jgi:hypothetical protein
MFESEGREEQRYWNNGKIPPVQEIEAGHSKGRCYSLHYVGNDRYAYVNVHEFREFVLAISEITSNAQMVLDSKIINIVCQLRKYICIFALIAPRTRD